MSENYYSSGQWRKEFEERMEKQDAARRAYNLEMEKLHNEKKRNESIAFVVSKIVCTIIAAKIK